MYLNRQSIIGFLGSAEQRFTKTNNVPYTILSIATKTSWKDKQTGEYVSRSEWHRGVCWGSLGQWAAGLTKGTHLAVEGELRSREWIERIPAGDKSKKSVEVKRRVWEIRVDSILKLDRAERDKADTAPDAEATEEVPF
jgi:single-strand DNA-binding protein